MLQARDWFLSQAEVLHRVQVTWSNEVILRPPRESDKEYLRFGLSLEDLAVESWGSPASGVRGMSRPTGMRAGLLIFDPSVDLTSRIGEQCARIGRSQCWCV